MALAECVEGGGGGVVKCVVSVLSRDEGEGSCCSAGGRSARPAGGLQNSVVVFASILRGTAQWTFGLH
jgi:hypothetical protein